MSGKDFWAHRYEALGWKFRDVTPCEAIRINSVNAENKDVAKRLEALGIKLQKIPFVDGGYWVSESEFSVGATAEYLFGLYSIQEAAAQIPATLFTNLTDKLVLDACAAPGGKTVQLADLMRNTGAIIALDVKKSRLTALANHLERCHIRNTVVYHMDARQASKLRLKFDCVLLDVPCSGNFVTDEDWFRQRTLADVKRNAVLQREILSEAVQILKEDGELVYSTCSLEPEENELNVDWAVKSLGVAVEKIECFGEEGLADVFGKRLDASIVDCRRIWPGETQGFFVCVLRRARNHG